MAALSGYLAQPIDVDGRTKEEGMSQPNDQAEIPTPRTIAKINEIGKSGVDWTHCGTLMANEMKKLERELHQANEENKSLKSRVAELEKAGGRLVMELENLRTDSGYNGNSEGMDLYHTAIDSAMKST